MTGEMTKSEVTRENYPGIFALRDALKRRGIASEPRPFDQYQGPYLMVNELRYGHRIKVWYTGETYFRGAGPVEDWHDGKDARGAKLRRVDHFVIESGNRDNGNEGFETEDAERILMGNPEHARHGVYTLRQAASRIAQVAK